MTSLVVVWPGGSRDDLWRLLRTHDGRRHPRRSSVSMMVGDISGALPMCPGCLRHLRLLKTYPMRLRHIRFWDISILVRRRHWWSCAMLFHCDRLNPSAGLNIFLVITSLLLSHITPYWGVAERE